jgi:hypothetical protein
MATNGNIRLDIAAWRLFRFMYTPACLAVGRGSIARFGSIVGLRLLVVVESRLVATPVPPRAVLPALAANVGDKYRLGYHRPRGHGEPARATALAWSWPGNTAVSVTWQLRVWPRNRFTSRVSAFLSKQRIWTQDCLRTCKLREARRCDLWHSPHRHTNAHIAGPARQGVAVDGGRHQRHQRAGREPRRTIGRRARCRGRHQG